VPVERHRRHAQVVGEATERERLDPLRIDDLERTLDDPLAAQLRPGTPPRPALVRTGLLFAWFAVLWAVFLVAMVVDPSILDTVRRSLESLPFLLQAVAWLLFLPLTAALWVWGTDWEPIVRVVLVVGIAGWNLLTFLPRRGPASPAAPIAE
jgi:hypothetical protein